MNASSPEGSQATPPELANNQNSLNSGRWLLLAIMTVLLLWGIYLARGAFLLRQNLWQGALVLICVLVYLCFWGGMLASRRLRRASPVTSDDDETRYSKACVTGFSISLLGLVFTVMALLLIPRSALGDGLILISVILNPLGLLLSMIGLSNPGRRLGKKLGLSTLPLTLVWFVAAILYVSVAG